VTDAQAGGVSRRALLGATGAGVAASLGLGPGRLAVPAAAASASTAGAASVAASRTVLARHTLTATVRGTGHYVELPFGVPAGTTRVDVRVRTSNVRARVGLGLFDHRGSGYQSAGFRGVYGAERAEAFVSAAQASEAFLPGPVEPGIWTVIVPVFLVPTPTTVTVEVTCTAGPTGRPFRPGPLPGVVRDAPGWYCGDLHCHTPASSDAWASGSAMTPRQWADAARAAGLDFVAMTDHNVVTQNQFLARDAGGDVLLLAGEEMTNWFHGHATVSGLDVGDWLDWRQAPAGRALPPHHARIADFLAVARRMGAYVAAAHPLAPTLMWEFAREAHDPASRPAGWEVWTGPWQPDDAASVRRWDSFLRRGWRVSANGGSDLHGVDNDGGFAVGLPTTVVYADRLARDDVIAALHAGRCFVTRAPRGVQAVLVATRSGQAAGLGGTIAGDAGDRAAVTCHVYGGAGMTLLLLAGSADGTRAVAVRALRDEHEVVDVEVPIPAGGGFVRAEVRSRAHVDLANPLASTGAMECLTNPVYLIVGDPPARPEPVPPLPG
jgi:hypothetical protein